MRYFGYLPPRVLEDVFYIPPLPYTRDMDKETLAYAVGALLYMPANRARIASDIITRRHEGFQSAVLCLEDAVGDLEVDGAEGTLLRHIKEIGIAFEKGRLTELELPLLFVRVRCVEQMQRLANQLGKEQLELLTGFVFPKFSSGNGAAYFETLENVNRQISRRLYAMPILESPAIIYKESRIDELLAIKNLLDIYRDRVLNVRIGATDLSGIFGLRRGNSITIYDVAVIRDCIGDIVNVFGRGPDPYVIAGPVWEYFGEDVSGLLQEVKMDRANGLVGKTVIHPDQLQVVQSCYIIGREEYADACSIMEAYSSSGASKSPYHNKMNESKPHMAWAKKVLRQAQIYGVFHEGENERSLLTRKLYV
ncbi:HpcH/HpaI aldolase/citrate lyase family protein [Aneurinibacillus sp. Ricciae_BoGa-3]|uniref:HpcH/HpaI aldolase/citrate lyase family protein n=1 Tax=Aneurinibacillus sp. Ricciae_BoGa-3 TaxID=3022697 RepID=UPI002341C640|nr:HpcH/HpaI aldolase/citrate lyase family protein [Aneurinibacillus sp. Ricciae_BoGa-3]WCK55581.1 HpcH/HpaI aldolase/citrate lyase family protein [Aneurinibacillus sp. Ricciae_BoGa-3]